MACVDIPEDLQGYGAILRYKDPLTGEFVTVGGTTDLSAPQAMVEDIETTTGDHGEGWETFIPNKLRRVEDEEFEVNFRRSQISALWGMFEDGTVTEWQIVLANAAQTALTCCAYIRTLRPFNAPMRELVRTTFGLKWTGKPALEDLNV